MLDAVALHRRAFERLGQHEQPAFAGVIDLLIFLGKPYQNIIELGIERNRQIGRQRPRRRGPDCDRDFTLQIYIRRRNA